MHDETENNLIQYLKKFKGKSGLYIIKVKPNKLHILEDISMKLFGYPPKSNIAYVGKGSCLKTTDLYSRSKQEMGWSNFEGATFMKKIGRYLGYKIEDKKNILARKNTREFIIQTFDVECIEHKTNESLLAWEREMIIKLKSCLNSNKNNF
jgi:hypothetical protein